LAAVKPGLEVGVLRPVFAVLHLEDHMKVLVGPKVLPVHGPQFIDDLLVGMPVWIDVAAKGHHSILPEKI
jgi:hypothetical protein